MSSLWNLDVEINGYKKNKRKNIIKSLKESWNLKDYSGPHNIVLCGDDSMSQLPDEMSEYLTDIILKENDGPAEINMVFRYLENLPSEEYFISKKEAKERIKKLKRRNNEYKNN